MRRRHRWTADMISLLFWMRSEGMEYHFCAYVLSKETGWNISDHACEYQVKKVKRG